MHEFIQSSCSPDGHEHVQDAVGRAQLLLQRFSGCMTRIHLRFWRMCTDERVRSLCLHHLHVGFLPVSTHDINLTMNTQYSRLDLSTKLVSVGHTRMRQLLERILVKQPENLCTITQTHVCSQYK